MKLEATHGSDSQWLVVRTGAPLTQDAKGIKAVALDGAIRGMIVYDHWTRNSVQAHMAVESPIVWRYLLPDCFRYPFDHIGILLGVIPANNLKSLAMVRALGFMPRDLVRDGFAIGIDLTVWEMRREDCRWLRNGNLLQRRRHEHQVSSTAA